MRKELETSAQIVLDTVLYRIGIVFQFPLRSRFVGSASSRSKTERLCRITDAPPRARWSLSAAPNTQDSRAFSWGFKEKLNE